MGDPLESDTLFIRAAEEQDKGKDSDGEKAPAEESAEEVVETIIQDVINYMVDEEERDDDITLVAVKVT
mgnify:CR=1 FL=1